MDSAYLAAVTVQTTTVTTGAQNVRLGDQINGRGTVTVVSRFGGQLYIETDRGVQLVKLPDSPVTVTRTVA